MTTIQISAEALANPRVQRLLGRSALYELLALALVYPEAEAFERATILAEDLADHEVVTARDLTAPLQALHTALGEVTADRIAPVHFVLFEGSVLCSPHETEYIRDPLAKAAQLGDIAGFYAAFGLKISESHRTTPDEISTELEFMSMLTRKEAYAALRAWTEREEIARDAGRRFLELHLGRWTAAFTADLCERADEAAAFRDDPAVARWFHAVGDLLRASINAELRDLRLYPSLLTTRYADPDAGSLVCPMAPSNQGIDELDAEEAGGTFPLSGSLGLFRAPKPQ